MADRPNILLIMTDQHRLEAVGCYADTVCQTPAIDRLAVEGVRFENAYTSCPTCTPARASVMTGEFPHSHDLTTNIMNPGGTHHLPVRPDLLSLQLREAGYSCGYTGKWHLGREPGVRRFGRELESTLPKDVGFEGHNFPGHGGGGFWYLDDGYLHDIAMETGWGDDYQRYLDAHDYEFEREPLDSDHPPGHPAYLFHGPIEATPPYFLTDHTISLLDSFNQREEPFFIWHNFWGPHSPYIPTDNFLSEYPPNSVPPWPTFDWPASDIPGPHHLKLHPEAETRTWEYWEPYVRHYYAFVSMIDAQIGRLLDYMDSTGLLNDTIVIFLADHGETLGSHGGLTDKGGHHFEEINHIPLIIRFPDGSWADTVRSELVSLVDVYPTILDAAQLDDVPPRHGARSLFPLLNGHTKSWREAVCIEFDRLRSLRTVRIGDLKYGFDPAGEDQLFDLSIDPNETRNLIDNGAYADELAQARDWLRTWMESTGDTAYGSTPP